MASMAVRIGALVLNVALVILHSIEYVFSAPYAPHRKLHGLCVRTGCTVMRNWFRGTGDDWRFHHRDYALASMLLPGRLMQFGKWMMFDDLVGYDSQRLFGRRDEYVFVLDVNGNIVLNKMPTVHYMPDGQELSVNGPQDGIIKYVSRSRTNIDEDGYFSRVHPSDTYFLDHRSAITKEILYLRHPHHLRIIAEVNARLVDAMQAIRPKLRDDLELLIMHV